MHRIILYCKDLEIITGKGKKCCWKMMQTIKDALGKQKHQNLTIKEYCDYEGINYDEVVKSLKL
jgi:hypothetical protein